MYDTVSDAVKKLNKQGYDLSIADVQAILWYFEKNLYKTLGVQAKIEGISYEDAANYTYEKWQEAALFYSHVIKVVDCFQTELHDSNLIKLIAYIYYKLGVFNFYYFVDYEKAEHCFTQKYKLEVETLAAEKNIIYETNKTESLKFNALCNKKSGM